MLELFDADTGSGIFFDPGPGKDTWRDILWGRVPGRTGDTVGRSREMSQKGSIVVDTPLHTYGEARQTIGPGFSMVWCTVR
jgi:hypothetical protein